MDELLRRLERECKDIPGERLKYARHLERIGRYDDAQHIKKSVLYSKINDCVLAVKDCLMESAQDVSLQKFLFLENKTLIEKCGLDVCWMYSNLSDYPQERIIYSENKLQTFTLERMTGREVFARIGHTLQNKPSEKDLNDFFFFPIWESRKEHMTDYLIYGGMIIDRLYEIKQIQSRKQTEL